MTTTLIRRDTDKEIVRKIKTYTGTYIPLSILFSETNADRQRIEVKTEEDLIGPGAIPGTIPTDYEQATGLERLEILGKMEGVDVFDTGPLDASRRGTMETPIVVQSFGEER